MVVSFSSRPTSSEMTVPPVRIAISCSISLRRSPKPGALTHTQVQGAAQTVDDQGGQSLALNVLSDDDQLLAGLNDLLEDGQNAPEMLEIFLSVIRM